MGRVWHAATPRGRVVAATALALLVGGGLARYPVVVGLGLCLAALVVLELVSVLRSPTVALHRSIDPPVVVRHEGSVSVLRFAGHRRRGLARLEAADLVDGRLHPVRLPDTAQAEEVEVRYEIPTPRRGLIDVGPLVLRRHGLLGLATHAVDAGEKASIRVLPRRVPLHRSAAGIRRAAVGTTDSIDVGGTDLVGLHEYSAGDDLRRLHWATSARTGTLMVREDADPAEPHVCVLLDDRAEAYDDEPGSEPFEDAVELAAALCRVTVAAGQPLRFRVTSGRYAVDVPASTTGVPHPGGDEIALLLAEVGTVTGRAAPQDVAGIRDADVAVAVSGAGAGEREVALLLGAGHRRVLLLLDPRPFVASGQSGDVLVLRGGGSFGLAEQWDLAVGT
ncbi:DUF58 domain-containing protein [Nocardioides zeae]|uniref:DUF58 domain-containing protein n=1 Tax=Nocardioides imazamoxiresistens TaxID=3231893 RepID=A0ABU3PSP8_9ACTN|nr:DUF58 domain-containing protein [Nocardioides zeae]MDT9591882.1 DUF58 domain-containing protein [Nocardioides zeae]